jgi:hypothetical protein
MRPLPAALVLLLGSTVLAADPKPALVDPLPFDHQAHDRALSKAGLGCIDCHVVGLHDEGKAVALPPPPLSSCHACHQREVQGAGRGAPSECALCHSDRAELRPADHDGDWTLLHGAMSRGPGQTCADCHSAGQCLDCHDRRGAASRSPHGPGFARFHGIEARVDPRSCSTCHTEASCVSCHSSGGLPW